MPHPLVEGETLTPTTPIPEGSLVAWLDPLGSSNREWILSYFRRGDGWSKMRELMPPGHVHLASADIGPYVARQVPYEHLGDMIIMREGPPPVPSPWECDPKIVHTHPSVTPRIADVLIHAGIKGCTSRGACRVLGEQGALWVQWTPANEWEKLTDTDRDVRTKEFLVRRGNIEIGARTIRIKIQ